MGHEDCAESQNNRGNELESKRNTPCGLALCRTRATDEVRAVVNPEGYHDAEGDSKLLKSDKRATNFRRSKFGTRTNGIRYTIVYNEGAYALI